MPSFPTVFSRRLGATAVSFSPEFTITEHDNPLQKRIAHTNLRSAWYNRGNDEGREEDLFWERESHEPQLIIQSKKSNVA
jgi:hypothetical protein